MHSSQNWLTQKCVNDKLTSVVFDLCCEINSRCFYLIRNIEEPSIGTFHYQLFCKQAVTNFILARKMYKTLTVMNFIVCILIEMF